MLWPVHGSAGFHTGHSSCFGFTSPFRHLSSSLSRRLASPSILTRAGSPCSGHSSPALSLARDCRQLGEVSADSNSADGLSGSSTGLYLFHGFSCPKKSREASLNWQSVLVLRRAASVILARALRSAVFNDSARSGGTASDAVSSIRPPSFLGSGRLDDPYLLDSKDTSGSGVVAESSSLGTRYFARSRCLLSSTCGPTPQTWVGGSSRGRGHFRPLFSRGSGFVHQRQRALGCRESSSLFLLRKFQTPQWPCLRTTLRRSLTFATKGALDLSFSTPFLSASCGGWSLFR